MRSFFMNRAVFPREEHVKMYIHIYTRCAGTLRESSFHLINSFLAASRLQNFYKQCYQNLILYNNQSLILMTLYVYQDDKIARNGDAIE